MSPASKSGDRAAPIHLVKGDDAVLVGDAVRDLLDVLVGDGDRSLMIEELDAATYTEERGVPPAHRAYLAERLAAGKAALGFVFVPHVLVAAPIDLAGLELEPP